MGMSGNTPDVITLRLEQPHRFNALARIALVIVGLLIPAAVSPASPRSEERVATGAQLLDAGRYAEAAAMFREAIAADPVDPEAQFFLGAAWNRLGQPDAALQHLSRAAELGDVNPELAFETGWSLLMQREWKPAAEQLEAYERAHPGRGQTSEFLGRAYLGMGQYDRADVALREALKRDPDLSSVVETYQFVLAERRREAAGPRSPEPPEPILPATGSLLDRVLRNQFFSAAEMSQMGVGQPAWLSLSLGLGYDTNARGSSGQIFDPNVAPGKQTARGKPSGFGRVALDSGYTFDRAAEGRLTVSYQLLSDTYFRHSTHADQLDQYGWIEYARDVGEKFSVAARAWDQYTLIDNANFRNEVGGRLALDWKAAPHQLVLETAYDYAFDDYLFGFPPDVFGNHALVRDGQSHTVTLAAYLVIPCTTVELRGGLLHVWNFARGSDFDYHANGVFIGVTAPLPWQITVDANYTRTDDGYTNINTISDPFTRRQDHVERAAVRFTRPIGKRLTAYIDYAYNRDASNIQFYHYEDHVISGGVIWRF